MHLTTFITYLQQAISQTLYNACGQILHHQIYDGWQPNGVEIYIKCVKITVNLLKHYHGCKVLVELFLILNEKHVAAADAYEVTLTVTFFKMMN
jgi:hypothetical protein